MFLMANDRSFVSGQGPSKLANKGRVLVGASWYVVFWTNSIPPMVLANVPALLHKGIFRWDDNRNICHSMDGRLVESFEKVWQKGVIPVNHVDSVLATCRFRSK